MKIAVIGAAGYAGDGLERRRIERWPIVFQIRQLDRPTSDRLTRRFAEVIATLRER